MGECLQYSEIPQIAENRSIRLLCGSCLRVLKCNWLATIAWSGGLLFARQANAENVTECIQRTVTFDGISSLSYAAVTGDTGARAYIHEQYPAQCATSESDACKSHAYVLSGDVVAVGKACGAWAYSQYIGQKRVTIGWIASSRLSAVAALTSGEVAQEPSDSGGRYHFVLTSGHGTPVCEAYLQRLNLTDFEEPPYCGRPESTTVPGFDLLQRRWMSRADYVRLLPRVGSFLQNRPIEDFYVYRKGPDGKDILGPPLEDFYSPTFLPFVWFYAPPVDIGNNGAPVQVVIWSEEDRNDPSCSVPIGPQPLPARPAESGVILTADSSDIDQTRTRAVFQHPDAGFWGPTGPHGKGPKKLYPGYRPIGTDVGIFRYRGVTYFDTFFTNYELGDFHDARRHDKRLPDTLGVFVHTDLHTQEVCEYYIGDQGD